MNSAALHTQACVPGAARVFCLLGDERVCMSPAPDMFTRVMRRLGLRGAYVPFKVKPTDLAHAISGLRALNVAGANVTAPYSQAAIPLVDSLSEGAAMIGAINTIVVRGEHLKGYNTIAIGLMDALSSIAAEVEGKSVLVLGTGGAARAAVFILNWLRTAHVMVVGRSEGALKSVCAHFGVESVPFSSLPGRRLEPHIVINATSVSSVDESPDLPLLFDGLKSASLEVVLDLNVDRPVSRFRDLAESRDARFLDGRIPMACQARRTFSLWTGLEVPAEEFLEELSQTAETAR